MKKINPCHCGSEVQAKARKDECDPEEYGMQWPEEHFYIRCPSCNISTDSVKNHPQFVNHLIAEWNSIRPIKRKK
jgi:hypothetical protein